MNDKSNFIISLLSLLVAFVALVFSVVSNKSAQEANLLAEEANDIAKEFLPSRVVVINSNENLFRISMASGDPGRGETACNFSFLIRNLSKNDATIIGYRVDISNGKSSMSIGSQTNTLIDEAEQFNHIKVIKVDLLKEEYYPTYIDQDDSWINPSDELLHDIPFILKAGDDHEVYSWFLYTTVLLDILKSPISNNIRDGYLPVDVVYSLILSNGEEIIAPPVTCYYIKE